MESGRSLYIVTKDIRIGLAFHRITGLSVWLGHILGIYYMYDLNEATNLSKYIHLQNYHNKMQLQVAECISTINSLTPACSVYMKVSKSSKEPRNVYTNGTVFNRLTKIGLGIVQPIN